MLARKLAKSARAFSIFPATLYASRYSRVALTCSRLLKKRFAFRHVHHLSLTCRPDSKRYAQLCHKNSCYPDMAMNLLSYARRSFAFARTSRTSSGARIDKRHARQAPICEEFLYFLFSGLPRLGD